MQDAGIVRNRAKIEGAVTSARAYLKIMESGPGFSVLLWDFLDGKPKLNTFRSRPNRCRRKPNCRAKCRRSSSAAASNSSGRPSSMPSCRRSAWSTTIWLRAIATRPVPSLPSAHEQSPQKCEKGSAARLAAHAVGPAARSARPVGARRRDRGHRPRPCPRRALERADQGRAYFLGRPACPAGGGAGARQGAAARCARPPRGAAARRAGIRDRRHDLAVQGGDRRQLQGSGAPAARRHPSALRPAGARCRTSCKT